ncbi:putative CubicO group peptidase [Paratrimastix pyriformis]|uniref:CubicO group peptidase n=1 Tax=Paratrimastix pyriformis TaxID=342808 RepID=A0ABQ8UTU1_9EUKA|nr:putative CubicO group peptidase [Paratrimastix pyriformis]
MDTIGYDTDQQGVRTLHSRPSPEFIAKLWALSHSHPMAGHMGYERSLKRAQAVLKWPGMPDDLTTLYKQCPTCQKLRAIPASAPEMHSTASDHPFDTVFLDYIGPLSTCQGYRYVLTAIDRFSRYTTLTPVRTTTATDTAQAFFEDWICRFGLPRFITTDGGSHFANAVMKDTTGSLTPAVQLSNIMFALLLLPLLASAIPTGVDISYQLPYLYPPTAANSTFDNEMLSLMEKWHVAGLTAAVITQGELVWQNAYGWLNVSAQRPFRTDDAIRIASMSKSVTATAFMQMVDRGFIKSLDDDVAPYLGYKITNVYFPDEPLTFRRLLTHTSGLHDDYLDFVVASYGPDGPKMSLKELVLPGGKYYDQDALFNSQQRPGTPECFEYSNLNPIIIATVVEQLTYKIKPGGIRFDQYCRQYIFEPLGMHQTSFNMMDVIDCKTATPVPDHLAAVYQYFHATSKFGTYIANCGSDEPANAAALCAHPTDYSAYVVGTNGAMFGPQGGVRTTARDYSRYQLAHINQGAIGDVRILTAASAALMQSVQWKGDAEEGFFRMYGFYLQQTQDLIAGKTLVGHTGDAYGMQGAQFFEPTEGWGILMFASGATRDTIGVFPAHEYDIVNLLYRTFVHQGR